MVVNTGVRMFTRKAVGRAMKSAKSASGKRKKDAPRRVPQRARKEPGEFAGSRRSRRSIRWILREAEGKKSYAEKLRSVLRPTLLGWTP